MSNECVKCGKVSKRTQELYKRHSGSTGDHYVPSGVYVCSAETSCKVRRRKNRHPVDDLDAIDASWVNGNL